MTDRAASETPVESDLHRLARVNALDVDQQALRRYMTEIADAVAVLERLRGDTSLAPFDPDPKSTP